MLTISDYSSIIEIGIGLNVAGSYVSIFVNPAITRAHRDLDAFRWWIDHPEKFEQARPTNLEMADLEDALTDWSAAFDRLEKAVQEQQKWPVLLALGATAVLFTTLLVPAKEVSMLHVALLVGLALLPTAGGASWVWCRTIGARKKEREACRYAKSLFHQTDSCNHS